MILLGCIYTDSFYLGPIQILLFWTDKKPKDYFSWTQSADVGCQLVLWWFTILFSLYSNRCETLSLLWSLSYLFVWYYIKIETVALSRFKSARHVKPQSIRTQHKVVTLKPPPLENTHPRCTLKHLCMWEYDKRQLIRLAVTSLHRGRSWKISLHHQGPAERIWSVYVCEEKSLLPWICYYK